MFFVISMSMFLSTGDLHPRSSGFEPMTKAEARSVTGASAEGWTCTIGSWACQDGASCPPYPDGGEYCPDCHDDLRNQDCIFIGSPGHIEYVSRTSVCNATIPTDCAMGRPGGCDLLLGCIKNFNKERVSCGTQDICAQMAE